MRHIDNSILKDMDFTDMDQHTCYFFHQDLGKYHESKIDEGDC